MPSLGNCFDNWESQQNISPHASMQRWNCPSIESISDFKSWNVIFCSAGLDVRYTADLDTLTLLDVWTSRDICKVDFKELWGLFGKLNVHHFDWEPGVCHLPAFSWSYTVGLFFQVSVEGNLGLFRYFSQVSTFFRNMVVEIIAWNACFLKTRYHEIVLSTCFAVKYDTCVQSV